MRHVSEKMRVVSIFNISAQFVTLSENSFAPPSRSARLPVKLPVKIKFVISFAGIPSIVFIVLVVVAIILIQKLYTEKEVVKTAWIDA